MLHRKLWCRFRTLTQLVARTHSPHTCHTCATHVTNTCDQHMRHTRATHAPHSPQAKELGAKELRMASSREETLKSSKGCITCMSLFYNTDGPVNHTL